MKEKNLDPRKILNRRYIKQNPVEFFRRREQDNKFQPKPNAAHHFLADLERSGKDIRVLTQNVDSLHYKAGHRYVLELHGNDRRWFCLDCERVYLKEELVRDEDNIPRCYVDNGIVRPDITYFGEKPKTHVMEKAKKVLSQSDLLIIAGTSLTVPPTKNLIDYFDGENVIVINKERINTRDLKVDLFIQAPVGKIFEQLNNGKQNL